MIFDEILAANSLQDLPHLEIFGKKTSASKEAVAEDLRTQLEILSDRARHLG